jgi:hypothetical protein
LEEEKRDLPEAIHLKTMSIPWLRVYIALAR